MTKLPTLITSECRRAATIWWSYRVSAISSLLIYAFIFPLLMLLFQHLAARHGTTYGPGQQLASLLGFLVWYLCMKTMAGIPGMIEEEAAVGTLENVWLLPLSPLLLLVSRIIALCLRYLLEMILLAVMLSLLLRLPLNLTPLSLLIIFLTLAGTCGVGIGLAGLAIAHKSVGSIAGIIANLALIISGALVPLNNLTVLFTFLKYLFPTTWGIDLLRQAVAGQSVSPTEAAGLFLQTMIFILIGSWLFNQHLARARLEGSLSTY